MLVNVSQREVKVEFDNNLYISMSTEVYQELLCYVKHYKTEVSGCGLVERIEHKIDDKVQYEFKIKDVYLPAEQDNTGGSTDIKEAMIHKLMTMLIQENKDISALKLHWHSHADMGVFHSGTDKDNYETLDNKDYLVSLVLNHNEEMLGSVHLYKPLALDVTGVPVYIDVPAEDTITDKVKRNIEALDKYTKDSDEHYLRTCGCKTGIDNKKDKKWKKGQRRKVRDDLKLSNERASKFDMCDSSDCLQCPDETVCHEYTYALMEDSEDSYEAMMRARDGYAY